MREPLASVQVMEQLAGGAPLPWESEVGTAEHIKTFEKPVMQLLHRSPSRRPSLRTFQHQCSLILESLLGDS